MNSHNCSFRSATCCGILAKVHLSNGLYLGSLKSMLVVRIDCEYIDTSISTSRSLEAEERKGPALASLTLKSKRMNGVN